MKLNDWNWGNYRPNKDIRKKKKYVYIQKNKYFTQNV